MPDQRVMSPAWSLLYAHNTISAFLAENTPLFLRNAKIFPLQPQESR